MYGGFHGWTRRPGLYLQVDHQILEPLSERCHSIWKFASSLESWEKARYDVNVRNEDSDLVGAVLGEGGECVVVALERND